MNTQDSDASLNAVVADAIRFIESLTACFGPEKGMEVWDVIGDAAGPTIKRRVFLALLSAPTNDGTVVKFTAGGAELGGNAIPVIKCIRAYTGAGLKEAKDKWDLCKTRFVECIVQPGELRFFTQELRNYGCIVQGR